MKQCKWGLLLAVLVACLLLAVGCTSAEDALEYALTEDGEAYVVAGMGGCTDTRLSIPGDHRGKPVVGIAEGAFAKCADLESVDIPDGVTYIGDSAFLWCSKLVRVGIPDSVAMVGNHAFEHCKSLKDLVIPDGVTALGDSALADCVSLSCLQIPAGVTSVGTGVCYGCTELTDIQVAEGNPVYHAVGNCLIETNSGRLVAGCKESVIPGDGCVTRIGEYAFLWCTQLTHIDIPDSVVAIEDYAFSCCKNLTDIAIPDSVVSMGASVFYACSKLEKVSMGNSVTGIGKEVFRGCYSLESITIPDSVTAIGEAAFSSCHSLSSITIPFVGATLDGTENTHFGYIFGAKSYKQNADQVSANLKTVVITGGTKIESNAFSGCKNITEVTIPDSVTEIGASAFSGCSALESITIPFVGATLDGTENTHFGYIFGAKSYKQNADQVSANLKTVVITGGTKIESNAFSGCKNITEVTIPDSVTEIGASAFSGCSALESITIPDSVTCIGKSTFAGCSKLKSVAIPDSVTAMGESAFSGCSALESITIPDSVTCIGKSTFAGCSKLKCITFCGTQTQWKAIQKGEEWESPVKLLTIYCTDGTIEIKPGA